MPNSGERAIFGEHTLDNPLILAKPADVPEDHIAYNPSGIWTVERNAGRPVDIMYVRVEPNRSDPTSSHLGKAVVRPYIVDPFNPNQALVPYHEGEEFIGEDASLTRIKRRLGSGAIEDVWLLSYVDVTPHPVRKNEVLSLRTRFYAGVDLTRLEHVADGPEWMKDVRVTSGVGPLGTELEVFGRPQLRDIKDNGNISHVSISGLHQLTAENIAAADLVHEQLLPVGSGVWGGVNDIARVGLHKYLLAAHRAWRTGADGAGRHYEAVMYGFDVKTRRIVDLGVLATAGLFPGGVVKDDTMTDLSDVVFTGGGYNGNMSFMTFGVGDGNIGLAQVRRLITPSR